MNQKLKLLFAILVAGFLLGGSYLALNFFAGDKVEAQDQPFGEEIKVDGATLTRPGLIVVEVFLPSRGFVVLASSRVIPADSFEQMLLEVYPENIPEEDLTGQRAYVRIYDDTNENTIHDHEDKVRKNLLGREVRDTFTFVK